ncbi:MAG: hypothetical protein HY717_08980 [Planctomycetes bacterium]|nr:hypothetical protein [Planctomycetota bacterium]
MTGWEDRLESREPSPLEQAIRKEEQAQKGKEEIPEGLQDDDKRLLRKVLQQLMKDHAAGYIIYCEFCRSGGDFAILPGRTEVQSNWGFYSNLARRWNCSPNTIKNWLKDALRFIVEQGRKEMEKQN